MLPTCFFLFAARPLGHACYAQEFYETEQPYSIADFLCDLHRF
jgi:hypothetical protein